MCGLDLLRSSSFSLPHNSMYILRSMNSMLLRSMYINFSLSMISKARVITAFDNSDKFKESKGRFVKLARRSVDCVKACDIF